MADLLTALGQFVLTFWDLARALGGLLLPWLPLAAWIVFWMFAVNWQRLRVVLAEGGILGVVLIALVAILVWGSIAPPEGGASEVFHLRVSNYVQKAVYVTGLVCIMLMAGAVQLSGFWGDCCRPVEPILLADAHGGHAVESGGHDGHGGHAEHSGDAAGGPPHGASSAHH